MAVTATVGLVLINSVYSIELENAVSASAIENEYALKSFKSLLETAGENIGVERAQEYFSHYFNSGKSADTSVLQRNMTYNFEVGGLVDNIGNSEQSYAVIDEENKVTLQTVSKISYNSKEFYVQTLTDITDIYNQREDNIRLYRYVLIGTAVSGSAILLAFSLYITRPFKKLSEATGEISQGNFEKRISYGRFMLKSEETADLVRNFNVMAQYIEDYTEELKLSVKNREDFTANFTHELKTPMTSIIGYADMLRSYDLSPELRRESADAIYREGKRLEELSLKLLELMVLKNETVKLENISSAALFKEVLASVKYLSEKYNIKINSKIDDADISVQPALIKSVLYNLIDNACKASKNGAEINVRGKCDGKHYVISVEDFGRGMSPEVMERITQPFYMEDKSRSRTQGGAGLGLSLCKQILELHGCELKFKSSVGIGTVASFALPTG